MSLPSSQCGVSLDKAKCYLQRGLYAVSAYITTSDCGAWSPKRPVHSPFAKNKALVSGTVHILSHPQEVTNQNFKWNANCLLNSQEMYRTQHQVYNFCRMGYFFPQKSPSLTLRRHRSARSRCELWFLATEGHISRQSALLSHRVFYNNVWLSAAWNNSMCKLRDWHCSQKRRWQYFCFRRNTALLLSHFLNNIHPSLKSLHRALFCCGFKPTLCNWKGRLMSKTCEQMFFFPPYSL